MVGCTHPTKRPSHSNSIEECYPRLNRPEILRTNQSWLSRRRERNTGSALEFRQFTKTNRHLTTWQGTGKDGQVRALRVSVVRGSTLLTTGGSTLLTTGCPWLDIAHHRLQGSPDAGGRTSPHPQLSGGENSERRAGRKVAKCIHSVLTLASCTGVHK
jgi:hypothetical protein